MDFIYKSLSISVKKVKSLYKSLWNPQVIPETSSWSMIFQLVAMCPVQPACFPMSTGQPSACRNSRNCGCTLPRDDCNQGINMGIFPLMTIQCNPIPSGDKVSASISGSTITSLYTDVNKSGIIFFYILMHYHTDFPTDHISDYILGSLLTSFHIEHMDGVSITAGDRVQ